MKPMAIYGSLTSAILEWFTFLPEAAHVLLLGALILVSFGVCLWLCARGDEERLAARVALATGVLAAVTVNKQIIRPGIANQMTVYVAVGAAMTLYLLRNSARLAQRRLMVLGMAFILAAWLEPVQVPVAFSAISARLGELPGDLRLLFRDSSEFQSVQADYFTSQQRFPTYLPLIRRLKELTGYRPGAGPKLKFYVFGDDAALYAAMQQKPPYYLTFYQESPVDAQMEVVRWLEWEDPTFIVWSPGFKEFDGVPNPVRVPIVFDSVIAKYEFLESVGEFDILRRRSSTSPFRLDYWRRKLGDFVDLRALPALSALRSSAPCKGVPRYCVEALRIHVTSPSPARTLAVPFRVGADRFEVKLSTFEGVNEYFINLQRLWFWGPLKRVGLTPELALAQRGPGMALLQLNSKLGLY
jgi:hypothetical protein